MALEDKIAIPAEIIRGLLNYIAFLPCPVWFYYKGELFNSHRISSSRRRKLFNCRVNSLTLEGIIKLSKTGEMILSLKSKEGSGIPVIPSFRYQELYTVFRHILHLPRPELDTDWKDYTTKALSKIQERLSQEEILSIDQMKELIDLGDKDSYLHCSCFEVPFRGYYKCYIKRVSGDRISMMSSKRPYPVYLFTKSGFELLAYPYYTREDLIARLKGKIDGDESMEELYYKLIDKLVSK